MFNDADTVVAKQPVPVVVLLKQNVVEAIDTVNIPRILITFSGSLSVTLEWMPWVATYNTKEQGQTLQVAGLHLKNLFFPPETVLYLAYSRARVSPTQKIIVHNIESRKQSCK